MQSSVPRQGEHDSPSILAILRCLAVPCACLLGLLLLGIYLGDHPMTGVDGHVDRVFKHYREPTVAVAMQLAAGPGTKSGALVIALTSGGWAWCRRGRIGASYMPLAAYVLAFSIVQLIKPIVDRVPPYRMNDADMPAHGLSFPSAHVALAVSVVGAVVFIECPRVSGRGRYLLFVLGTIAIAGVALSTIHLHRHWLTDVLGGLMVGGLVLGFVIPLPVWLSRDPSSFASPQRSVRAEAVSDPPG
jgi:membrane-associated phospholipid phosphatase